MFASQARAVFSDEDYRALQLFLGVRPDAGPVIRGSGDLRKVRWRLSGRGKRGGVRVTYYWRSATGVIHLLFLYRKSAQGNASPAQLRAMRKVVDSV